VLHALVRAKGVVDQRGTNAGDLVAGDAGADARAAHHDSVAARFLRDQQDSTSFNRLPVSH
jgi:hypothetical protein